MTSLRGKLIAVAGPSGVGKSTVVRRAVNLEPALWLSVSATTRSPRPGEVDGVDYLFVSQAKFEALRDSDGLLELANFAGNWYGTPRQPVEDRLVAGISILLEIDLQGVRLVKVAMPEVQTVFIQPPSWEVLRDRLTSRGTEDADALERRLAAARTELAAVGEFDHAITNADVDDAATQLVALFG